MEQVEKMQEALSKLVDEAGARTREEVDNVKKQCNQNISRLMEEIHTSEMVSTFSFRNHKEIVSVHRATSHAILFLVYFIETQNIL